MIAVKQTFERALALHRRGRLSQAAKLYRSVLRAHPRHAKTLHLLGRLKLQEGDRAGALRLLRSAVQISPSAASCHEDLAEALYRSGDIHRAEAEARLALRFDDSLHRPWNLIGLIHLDQSCCEQAIEAFTEAMRRKIPYPEAMIHLAVALNRKGEFELADRYSRLALRVRPDSPHAWSNLGISLKGRGLLDEAQAAFERASALPLARVNLGYVHLLRGNVEEGLRLYEKRKEILGIGRGMKGEEWDGQPHPGRRLLVIHEQGLGDTILMSRFFERLTTMFAGVSVLVQPPLERLIALSVPSVTVCSGTEGIGYDYWCPTMSLPLLLGIDRVDRIPVDPWIRSIRSASGSSSIRIGLNWAGNPSFAYDRVRSAHLDDLALLLRVGGVEWVSLHKGHLENEAARYGLATPLAEARDLLDTAEVIAGLDLVVSTETAVPNLSAAMGIPTCVLASKDHDWRWRDWYRGVEVLIQEAPGNWYGPVAGVLQRLEKLLASVR